MANFQLIDTVEQLTPSLVMKLKNDGISTVIKYCADSEQFPYKRLSHAERSFLVSAGIKSAFAFERGNTPGYYSKAQGISDAVSVLDYFDTLGVPAPTPVFATVDFDDPQYDTQVMQYLLGFHATMGNENYLVGVYGSGHTCKLALDAGVAHFDWLANADKWTGYNPDEPHTIIQKLGSPLGLNGDPDEAVSLDHWTW